MLLLMMMFLLLLFQTEFQQPMMILTLRFQQQRSRQKKFFFTHELISRADKIFNETNFLLSERKLNQHRWELSLRQILTQLFLQGLKRLKKTQKVVSK